MIMYQIFLDLMILSWLLEIKKKIFILQVYK